MGWRFLWQPDHGVIVSERDYGFLTRDTYLQSPIAEVFSTGKAIRRALAAPDCPEDYDVVAELRAEGFTDYLMQPLRFTNGAAHGVSWTTRRPGGFADRDLAILEVVCRPLARLIEIYALRRIAVTLLSTYVGHGAGERILNGQIRRGDLSEVHAVIFLSDLRGFTKLSQERPGAAVLQRLNAYFDCLVPVIEAQGGEVLKFIGDGLLAIFPITDRVGPVCRQALAAVHESRARLASLADAPMRYGMALHVGDVLYGNVGGANRLDFTTIGPAVNLTARLESLARDLEREVVLSTAFAQHCIQEVTSLGHFKLRDIQAPQEVFVPKV